MKQAVSVLMLVLLIGSSLCLYGSNSKVVKLTSSNFKEKVINSKGIWFVEFYAPWCGHCKQLAPTWEKIATALDGIVNIGAVDMDSDKEAGASYGISGFPTLKLFGANKNSPIDYNGGRDANALIRWAMDQAQQAAMTRLNGGSSSQQGGSQSNQGGSANSGPSEVVTLTTSNFNSQVYGSKHVWLVELYAPWCGHCKKLQPEWDAAARKTKGMVMFGKVNCDEEQSLCQSFGVRGYPTIKYFKPNSQSPSDAEEYQGGREEAGIVKVATDLFAKYGGELELNQIVSQDSFKKDCLESDKNACLIFFLPHVLDTAVPRSKFLKDIQTVMKDFITYPLVFLWSQGGDQFDFESQFPLGAGFPALLTIVPKKKKYSVMRTGQGFEPTHIKSYLNKLLTGSEVVYDLPAVIEPMRKVTAWTDPDKPKTK